MRLMGSSGQTVCLKSYSDVFVCEIMLSNISLLRENKRWNHYCSLSQLNMQACRQSSVRGSLPDEIVFSVLRRRLPFPSRHLASRKTDNRTHIGSDSHYQTYCDTARGNNDAGFGPSPGGKYRRGVRLGNGSSGYAGAFESRDVTLCRSCS